MHGLSRTLLVRIDLRFYDCAVATFMRVQMPFSSMSSSSSHQEAAASLPRTTGPHSNSRTTRPSSSATSARCFPLTLQTIWWRFATRRTTVQTHFALWARQGRAAPFSSSRMTCASSSRRCPSGRRCCSARSSRPTTSTSSRTRGPTCHASTACGCPAPIPTSPLLRFLLTLTSPCSVSSSLRVHSQPASTSDGDLRSADRLFLRSPSPSPGIGGSTSSPGKTCGLWS